MKNINTPKFWDKQFTKQWEALNKDKIPTDQEYFRWDSMRFDVMTRGIGHKGKILDIGCGMGEFSRYAKAKYPLLDITGLDFSGYAVDKAKKSDNRMEYIAGDLYKMDMFKDSQFDYAISTEVFEHLTYPEKMIEEVHRILKPGGILVISTPLPKGDGTLYSVEHVKEYLPEETRTIMSIHFDEMRFLKPPVFYDVQKGQLIELWWYAVVGTNKGGEDGK